MFTFTTLSSRAGSSLSVSANNTVSSAYLMLLRVCQSLINPDRTSSIFMNASISYLISTCQVELYLMLHDVSYWFLFLFRTYAIFSFLPLRLLIKTEKRFIHKNIYDSFILKFIGIVAFQCLLNSFYCNRIIPFPKYQDCSICYLFEHTFLDFTFLQSAFS